MSWGNKLLLMATAVLWCSLSATAAVNIPDWVRQAAAQTLPAYSPETHAVAILSEMTYTVTAPYEYTEHYRRVVKILRPEGRNEAELGVEIGHQEKLVSIHAWSIDAAGHEYEVKDKDFFSAGDFSSEELYNDISGKHATVPGADPGTVIGFEYEVRRHDYFNELDWLPQEDIPVRNASLTVQLPSGWELKDAWTGTDSVKPTAAGSNGWQWTKANLAAIEDEPHCPARMALSVRATISLYTSTERLSTDWAALGKYSSSLFQSQRSVTPEMTAKVQELTQGKTDFDNKVRTLTEFMQREVRYVGIEIGIGGFQPHAASDVFRVRYGDCKDKANLLSTMLAQAGINSEMMLIDTHRGVVRPELPGPLFNHAIVAIELPSGISPDRYESVITAKSGKRYVIFDPTDEWMPFGELSSELQDTYALLVTKDSGELIHIPAFKPDSSQVILSAKLKITSEGAISGDVNEKLTGEFALSARARAENSAQQQELQHIERVVAQSVKNATLQGLTLDNLKDLNQPVNVHFDIAADRYAQVMGPMLIIRPRVFDSKAIGLEHKPRKYPLVLGPTALETDDIVLELPAGYTVDDKPDPVSVDTPFASYKSQLEINGNRLHYTRQYVQKSLEIPADKIEELRAFENKVAEDENSAVVLKKVADSPGR